MTPSREAQQNSGRVGGARRRGRAIIHIGLNKAGSASIKHWLAENEAQLRKEGIHHDDLAESEGGHSHWEGRRLTTPLGLVMLVLSRRNPAWLPPDYQREAFEIEDSARLRRLVDDFEERFDASLPADASTYVASSEFIGEYLNFPIVVRDLDAWLGARFERVEYVVYLRDQVDWVSSAYGQAIKTGWTLSLDSFIAMRGHYDYHGFVRRWAGIVDPERLHVRLLEPDALVQGDLIADFASLIGANVSAMRQPPRMNPGLSRLQVETLRMANRLSELSRRLGLPDVGFRIRAKVYRMPAGKKMRLSPAQAARVTSANARDNENLRTWLFPFRPTLFGSIAPVSSKLPGSQASAPAKGLPHGRPLSAEQLKD